MNIPLPRINQKNFAINGRIYDTTKTTTLLNPSIYNMQLNAPDWNTTYNAVNNIAATGINTETAFGYSWFH